MNDTNTAEAKNTDRELWREREGDYYADSIHLTEGGGIGIDCGGTVITMTLRDWHLAGDRSAWNLIETAPKDGTPILLFGKQVTRRGNTMVIGRWKKTFSSWSSIPGEYTLTPTHWMPLPNSPER